MQFTEEQASEVKTWVVKRLEDISDADSDVLADYVLALIRSDLPDNEIREASIGELSDFLRENTVKFVDELFAKFAPKAQQTPSAPIPEQPSAAAFQNSSVPAIPSGPQSQFFGAPGLSAQAPAFIPSVGSGPYNNGQSDNGRQSRKRTFNEGFQDEQSYGDSQRGRSFKTARTRRGGGRGDRMGGVGGRDAGMRNPQFPQNAPGLPSMPPGFPGFDQNDPMAAMMALQNMGFPQMPGIPPLPMGNAGGPGGEQGKIDQPCQFYETNGICYLGAACPYKHGKDPVVVSSKDDEYDPAKSNIMDTQRDGPGASRGDRGRGRGRGGRDRGGASGRGRGGRADFSHVGPNDDKSVTTIVVENIPEDKFDEQVVRDYFAEFGTIAELTMQPHKQLALIKFEDHAAAKRAWSSPKAIFDNRFVKVYWYKPKPKTGETNGLHKEQRPESPQFDREDFERQQAEAQKAHEERLKKRKEAEEARLALEKQRDELMKKQQEEKAKLLERLGARGGTGANDEANGTTSGVGHDGDKTNEVGDEIVSEQTKSLRAQLAALEAEAKSLGIDTSSTARGRGRGSPGYRGRGSFLPRGRGYDPTYRGGYRGRGAMRGGRGGVLRLDNRPKRVAVSGVEFDSAKDEALRQYLIGIGEYDSIEPNPERADSVIIVFKDRYVAEKLMYGTSQIPSVGNVELSWVANPVGTTTPGGTASSDGKGDGEDSVMTNPQDGNGVSEMDKDGREASHGHQPQNDVVDYDVAEMDDSWGVGIN